MKESRKGFTLVELLAVIVILAIIMIVAIPSVLDTMETARKKSFCEYITKVYTAANNLYLEQSGMGGSVTTCSGSGDGKNCKDTNGNYVYYVDQLGMQSTGDYHGVVVVVPATATTKASFYIGLYDNNYMTSGVVYYDANAIDPDSLKTFSDSSKPSVTISSGAVDTSKLVTLGGAAATTKAA